MGRAKPKKQPQGTTASKTMPRSNKMMKRFGSPKPGVAKRRGDTGD
jgi:hypothetical protein